MKFVYRAFLAGLVMVLIMIYFFHVCSGPSEEMLLPYISDRFGDNCSYNGVNYKEGELFSEPCRQCYCSFGEIECAVVHCKEMVNTLGMNLIQRAVQVVIPTDRDNFAGTIAVMNSVLKHTKHPVKFSLVLFSQIEFDISHLTKWIEGTMLRFSDYNIIFHKPGWLRKRLQVYHESFRDNASPLAIILEHSAVQNNTSSALLLLRTLMPMEHRVIVLSSNVLIRGDVADLFNMNLNEKSIAVLDTCKGLMVGKSLHYKDYFRDTMLSKFNIPGTDCTFSPNVVVADLDRWFSGNTESRLFLRLAHSLLMRHELQKEINIMTARRYQDEIFMTPLLLHFHDDFLDLNSVWSVYNVGPKGIEREELSKSVMDQAKIINWQKVKPWSPDSQLKSVWQDYFLNDPTGLFRVNLNPSQNSDEL